MTAEITEWRKSSYSDPDGKCVEVGRAAGGTIGIRDSKEAGAGPILEFTRLEWAALLSSIRSV